MNLPTYDILKISLRTKTILIVLMLIGCAGSRLAAQSNQSSQSKYASSIKDHRYMYKRDLVAIIKDDTSMVDFFAPDPAYRLEAKFTAASNQPVFNMGTSSGQSKKARKFGTVEFKIAGKTYQLAAFQLLDLITNPEYQDYFFIPFTDATSGSATYGGGRYLDFRTGDIRKGKTLTLDFNKAYNPSCAFVEGYSCPIPPTENQLEPAIRAGEKNFLKSSGKSH